MMMTTAGSRQLAPRRRRLSCAMQDVDRVARCLSGDDAARDLIVTSLQQLP